MCDHPEGKREESPDNLNAGDVLNNQISRHFCGMKTFLKLVLKNGQRYAQMSET